MNTAMMATEASTAYSAACSAGQPVAVGMPGGWIGLPNSARVTSATAEIGFHSANARSGPGSVCAETNTLAMKHTGNSQISPALWATSTLRQSSPIQAPIQDIANAKNGSSR